MSVHVNVSSKVAPGLAGQVRGPVYSAPPLRSPGAARQPGPPGPSGPETGWEAEAGRDIRSPTGLGSLGGASVGCSLRGELLPCEPKVTSKAYGCVLWSLEGTGTLCVGLSPAWFSVCKLLSRQIAQGSCKRGDCVSPFS